MAMSLFESWLLIISRMSDSEKSEEVKICPVNNFNPIQDSGGEGKKGPLPVLQT